MAGTDATKLITQNRKARHNYDLEEQFEAGLVLVGTEVKSCRAGKANLTDAYVVVEEGEAYLVGCHIAPYSHGNRTNHEPERRRKLLLNRAEIDTIQSAITRDGRAAVPLRMYFKRGRAKVAIAIAKGRKRHDKRQAIATRDAEQRMRKEVGRRR